MRTAAVYPACKQVPHASMIPVNDDCRSHAVRVTSTTKLLTVSISSAQELGAKTYIQNDMDVLRSSCTTHKK